MSEEIGDSQASGGSQQSTGSPVTASTGSKPTASTVTTTGSGGYRRLKNQAKQFKKTTWEDRMNRGGEHAVLELGQQASIELQEDYKKSNKDEGDGMIMSLLSQGYSHVKIRGLFGVGGTRMTRLNKLHNDMQDPEYLPSLSVRHTPQHSLSDSDKNRVKDHIKDNYDLEEGYACQHRNQMLYFSCETVQWKDIYEAYVESIEAGQRILSRNRWREYVRFFYPQLRLHRSEGDLCNACYRIDISLQDPSITDEERGQLVSSKNTHIGKQNYISLTTLRILFYCN
jgi:hypothetical protein